jgi:hypothetical protein
MYLPISHNQFVDDTMTMGSTTIKEAYTIQKTMDEFFEVSSISINLGKYQVLFFNTPEAIQVNLSNLLGSISILNPSQLHPHLVIAQNATNMHFLLRPTQLNIHQSIFLRFLFKKHLFSWCTCLATYATCVHALVAYLIARVYYKKFKKLKRFALLGEFYGICQDSKPYYLM